MAAPPDLIDEAFFESLFEDIPTESAAILIPAVSARVKEWCGTNFYTTTYTEYLDGRGSRQIMVEQRPLIAITSIHDDYARTWGSGSLISSSLYSVNPKSGIVTLNRGYKFQEWNGNVKVIYTAGYGAAMANLPADLKEAVAKWVAIKWKLWETPNLGMKSIRQGDAMIVFDKGDPPEEVRPTLIRYKRMTRGS